MINHVVRLTEKERLALTQVTGKGRAAAQKIQHANVLLKLDAGGPHWNDAQPAEPFSCSAHCLLHLPVRC